MSSAAEKMSSALSNVSVPTITVPSLPSFPGRSSAEMNTASAQRSRELQLAHIELLLDNLRLQCPISTAGVALAYSTATLAPLDGIQCGLVFTWFRTGAHGSSTFVQVQQSQSPIYAPTVDDIGSRLCLQCQDSFDEGYIRYVESDRVLPADALLRSIASSSAATGQYCVSSVRASLGTAEANPFPTMPSSSFHSIREVEQLPEQVAKLTASAVAVSASAPSVSFSEEMYVCVEADGIFMGLAETPSPAKQSPEKVDSASPAVDVGTSRSTGTSNRSFGKIKTNGEISAKMIHGFRILSNPGISVKCSGPRSLLIRVPSTGFDRSTAWLFESVRYTRDIGVVDKCVASEMVVAGNKTLQELSKFSQQIPEDAKEFHVCLVCADRMERDVLVLTIRALCSDGLQKLPWEADTIPVPVPVSAAAGPVTSSTEKQNASNATKGEPDASIDNLSYPSEAAVEQAKRLNFLELQNALLKQERLQLMRAMQMLQENKVETANSPEHTSTSANVQPAQAEIAKRIEAAAREATSQAQLATSQQLLAHIQENQKLREEIDNLRRISHAAEGAEEVEENRRVAQHQKESAEATRIAQEREAEKQRQLAADAEALRVTYAAELTGLKTAVSKAQAEADKLKAVQEQLQVEHQKLSTELVSAKRAETAAKDELNSNAAHVAQLEGQLFSTLSLKMKQEGELSMLKEKLNAAELAASEVDKARSELAEARLSSERAAAQVNHEKKKSEGASKELKRVMKENAATMAAFEKALIRKSEECNLLYEKLQAAEQQGPEALSPSSSSTGSTIASVGSSMSESMKRLSAAGRSSFTSGLFGGSKKSDPNLAPAATTATED